MKITVIGNAIVDVVQQVDDNFLNDNGMEKGSMALIDKEKSKELKSYYTRDFSLQPGGSGANTATGFAHVGGTVDFIGSVSNDSEGDFFINSLISRGVNFLTKASEGEEHTAKSFIFVTPDAERTMNTYLGVSTDIEDEKLDEESIKSSDILYTEGYLFDSPISKHTIKHACNIAKENGVKIAFTLSDALCVARHRREFFSFIKDYVDILFGNEREILSLFDTDNFDYALDKIKEFCEITAITLGEEGSLIITKDEKIEIPCEMVEEVIDTTGAGDNYAAGFLYAYSKKESLYDCGVIGSELAAKVVQKIGGSL